MLSSLTLPGGVMASKAFDLQSEQTDQPQSWDQPVVVEGDHHVALALFSAFGASLCLLVAAWLATPAPVRVAALVLAAISAAIAAFQITRDPDTDLEEE